ncbi:histidine decarboxylase isoform X1 [Plutella xylostella]|uniref:histidine decarboxylase isoform X1 n=1 Tax=Plutella xylostella TaxID=51655 RepID=UPI0020329A1E|nr:histidine decarboxylase isoform X1 [Plutella xylostella]
MDHVEFRVKAKEMVDYIADYLEGVGARRVYPAVQPGYLHALLPRAAPAQPEPWDRIMRDVDDVIMPGLVHWQSPHMHAYFPALTSYPSIMGDFLSSALNVLCFTWASSPAGTELETIAMNWLGKILGLPECFLNEQNDSLGGGVIQTTASEATLVSLLAARTRTLTELSQLNPEEQSAALLAHLVCYCSDQAHSSVEKAGLIGLVRMRYIESDENQSMRGEKLEEAIISDKAKGLVPFWVCATLGTTGSVAFDNLREVAVVCQKYGAWLHIDAAYAGSAFVCPEFRHWMDGMEMADSFAFNPSKWLMVSFDCTAMWVKDSTALHRTFNVNPIYLRHENSGKAIDYMGSNKKRYKMKKIRTDSDTNGKQMNGKEKDTVIDDGYYYEDTEKLGGYDKMAPGCTEKIQLENPDKKEYLHWQIPLSRRFRALKLWFVLRNYGVSGLQKHIRKGVKLAKEFQALVESDVRFEVPQNSNLSLVVFRLKGDNALTERLLRRLNARGHMHAVPACFKDTYVIRFTVTSQRTTSQDILVDWEEIKLVASEILVETFGSDHGNISLDARKRPKVSLKQTRELNATFGTSLLLANSPMSPKIVNGTHAAICDYEQVLTSCAQTAAQLKMEPKDSPEMRRRIRGIKMSGKMFSLDSCMDLVQGLMVESMVLPQCAEEKEEVTSNGSSGDKSSNSTSPMASSGNKLETNTDDNQLQIPAAPRQIRSKSVDVSLSELFEDAKVTIDVEKNEIVITPTGSKVFADDIKKSDAVNDKMSIGEKFSQAFENLQDNLQMLRDGNDVDDGKDDEANSKLTIKGPGSYIKKLIQQFSEAPVENDDAKADSETEQTTMKGRADAICKKCLHYKGKLKK